MAVQFRHARWAAALLTFGMLPGACWATVGDYYVAIDNGTYNDTQNHSTQPFSGYFTINPHSGGSIDSLDITLSGATFAGTFNSAVDLVLNQEAISGNMYVYNIFDASASDNPYNQYLLHVVLDNWSDLVAGQDGATIDSVESGVQFFPSPGDVVANRPSSELVVPAPAALPVFATALGLLGMFRRRRSRGGSDATTPA